MNPSLFQSSQVLLREKSAVRTRSTRPFAAFRLHRLQHRHQQSIVRRCLLQLDLIDNLLKTPLNGDCIVIWSLEKAQPRTGTFGCSYNLSNRLRVFRGRRRLLVAAPVSSTG